MASSLRFEAAQGYAPYAVQAVSGYSPVGSPIGSPMVPLAPPCVTNYYAQANAFDCTAKMMASSLPTNVIGVSQPAAVSIRGNATNLMDASDNKQGFVRFITNAV